jgi:hypothetical protein
MTRSMIVPMIVVLWAILAHPAQAQQQDLPGYKPPPLESLSAFAPETPGIPQGAITISPSESESLSHSAPGDRLTLPSIDQHLDSGDEPLQFRRIELFAPGARVFVVGASGVVERQLDARQFYLATNRTTGIGLAVNTSNGEISGFAIKGDSKLRLDGQLGVGIELQSIEQAPDEVNSCGTQLDDQPEQSLSHLNSPVPESVSGDISGSSISFQTVVAVDTDTEWMAGKGNNASTATAWIAEAFLAMNVFFERDVETHLLIGDIILRIGSDPYSVASNRSDQMNEFASYWRLNMSATDRDFATLFSGRDIESNSFSGIAWINLYCNKGQLQNGRTVGSYSFNAIGSNRTPANTAIYIGHELAHNLGSPHTHCYSPTIDQCFKGESGCYSGSLSCPAGGKGTIMSYCHVSGDNGAGCGTNKSEFHSRVQTLLEGRLAANNPSCIADYEESPDPGETPIFKNDFESP